MEYSRSSPKKEMVFFDSFGIVGLKIYIIQDDQKIIEKVLLEIPKMKRTDNKLMLVKIKYGKENYMKLTKREISELSNSVKDLFHFIDKFGNLHNIKDFVSVYIQEDSI